MTRILWVGDAVIASGFARVTHGVLDQLHERHQVAVLGVGYHGGPHDKPYPVFRTSPADMHGKDRLLDLVQAYTPDVLVLFNDLWVVKEYLRVLDAIPRDTWPKILTYSPVDAGGLIHSWVADLDKVDAVCAYTEFGKAEILKAGFKGSVQVIPHGVDTRAFTLLDKAQAREAAGIAPQSWMVLNANRNQFRKRIDLTVKGFVDFVHQLTTEGLVDPERMPLLHLHMDNWTPTGVELSSLVAREFAYRGLNPAQWVSYTKPEALPLSQQGLNLLYNCADVGINTSMGEGWGLCSFEQAALGIPQIMVDCAASAELFRHKAWLLPVSGHLTIPVIGTEGALTHRGHVKDALLDAYLFPEKGMAFAARAKAMVGREGFRWEAIAARFEEVIRGITSTRSDEEEGVDHVP